MMFCLILVLIMVFTVYVYTRINRVRRYADKLPGETPWPIVGSAFEVGTDPVGKSKNINNNTHFILKIFFELQSKILYIRYYSPFMLWFKKNRVYKYIVWNPR